MSGLSILAVVGGGAVGCLLRWLFGIWLNPVFPTIPMGTVAVNLIGGLLIGMLSAFFNHHTGLAPEWRLLLITGFTGGFTTFSTFSIEIVTLLAQQEYGWALSAASLHLFGSLALTALGIVVANALFVRI